jgi:hypothetical protein
MRNELAVLQKRLLTREDDFRLAAAEAILSADDVTAESLLKPIREIVSIRKSLAPDPAQAHERIDAIANVAPKPIALPARGFSATIDGQRIQGWNDAGTFANAVERIGCENVATLGLRLNYCPLVSRELHRKAHQHYRMSVEKRGDWYIVTHCSTQRKRELLITIQRRLGVNLVIGR